MIVVIGLIFFIFSADSKEIEWTGLKFSPDGKSILISTNGSVIKLIDSYNGTSLQTFTGETDANYNKHLTLIIPRSPELQAAPPGGFLLPRLPVCHLWLKRRPHSHLEQRERPEGGFDKFIVM